MAEYVPGLAAADSEAIDFLKEIQKKLSVLADACKNVEYISDSNGPNKYEYDESMGEELGDIEVHPVEYGFPKEITKSGSGLVSKWVFNGNVIEYFYIKNNVELSYLSPILSAYKMFVLYNVNTFQGLLEKWVKNSEDVVHDTWKYPAAFVEDWSEGYGNEGFTVSVLEIKDMIEILQNRIAEQQALEKWQEEGGKSMSSKYDQVVSNPVTVCSDIVDVAIDGVALLDQATGSKAPELIRSIANVLKTAKIKLENTEGVLAEDVSAIEGQIENLNDIASRNHHSDIRSWDARFVQREDARLALGQISQYWKNVMKAYLSDQYNRRKSAASKAEELAGVPNYRFKVGQMVKVGNRYGKVIGASKEGGTGKQVYDVRLNGSDKIRKCSTNEMKAMSDSKKSNLGFE